MRFVLAQSAPNTPGEDCHTGARGTTFITARVHVGDVHTSTRVRVRDTQPYAVQPLSSKSLTWDSNTHVCAKSVSLV